MRTNDGRIFDMKDIPPEEREKFVEMLLPPTPRQMARRPPRVGRNDPCPCGSGKKFKRCCYTGPSMPRTP